MINGKRILALITARGGSKGIPNKNIKPLNSKPLLAWTIEAAKKSKYVDRLVISTDSPEIADVARSFGCEVPFVRPASLAQDNTSSMDVIAHALDNLEESFDYLLLLQPTSPFRTTYQIDECTFQAVTNATPILVSVSECHSHPSFVYTLEGSKLQPESGKVSKQLRRQDLPATYEHNGSLYVADINYLRLHESFNTPDTEAYIINGYTAIDIDTPDDWTMAELIALGLERQNA
ncbi:N-acylneuraminate cytidylyltransferase/CMP-N,N'-diacetyllegionaminic acid synthase [Halopseudomonas litoralis]|uniref:N-acylneuraminate cytidylyltransferase/CMP-N,N'-diacetyllegionaminic acid synthase n=1 Tax=Halopseudomonas litoralis TaxID=797277 RepID=A0A1H1U359_9GAMM|nr:acylneuraminate cytidylyltransferase family protein [Halopseudomonas litoralis]SDS66922.1 N-acylneuraminate cytidylyltransferase/CMP-N,N'-diacetyllegionaminic acid synthase [Halopseudomonas litoralis]